ncbi:hypothetical protein [Chryseobacterium defluvii]|uniref:Uncharacterized protein n=1 Tax=Chryseobacterium defluvii TaxID=160396 RepID=A0A495SNS3_9FLAO|nr:hypothetical protein [Chryseobacterium defluvii]RKT01080.1 hypothetical protein BCF58_0291 [Chryseobacterium defluvii]
MIQLIITIAIFILFVSHEISTFKILKKYKKLTDEQKDFIDQMRNDYDSLIEKYLDLLQKKDEPGKNREP